MHIKPSPIKVQYEIYNIFYDKNHIFFQCFEARWFLQIQLCLNIDKSFDTNAIIMWPISFSKYVYMPILKYCIWYEHEYIAL